MRRGRGDLVWGCCRKGISYHHVCLAETQRGRRGDGTALWGELRCTLIRCSYWSPTLEMGQLGGGPLRDWLREHIWPPLLVPGLEAGTKIRESVSYRLNSGRLGPTVPGVVVWLPGLLAADRGSESYFHSRSGRRRLVYSDGQLIHTATSPSSLGH